MADANKVLLDRLPTLRVVDLKEELKARGLSCAGVKAELSDRLKAELERSVEEGSNKVILQPSGIEPSATLQPLVQAVGIEGHGEQRPGIPVAEAQPPVGTCDHPESVSSVSHQVTAPGIDLEIGSAQTEGMPVPEPATDISSLDESPEKPDNQGSTAQTVNPLVTSPDPKVPPLKISKVQSLEDAMDDSNVKGASLTDVWSESVAGKDSPKGYKVTKPCSDTCDTKAVGDDTKSTEKYDLKEVKLVCEPMEPGSKDLEKSSDSESNDSDSNSSNIIEKHQDMEVKEEKEVEGNQNNPESPKKQNISEMDFSSIKKETCDMVEKPIIPGADDEQMIAINADASDLDDDKAPKSSSINDLKISDTVIKENNSTENIGESVGSMATNKSDLIETKEAKLDTPTVPFKSLKKIKIGRKTDNVEDSSRKRKWKRQSGINISSDVLKDLVPKDIEGDSEMIVSATKDVVLGLESEDIDEQLFDSHDSEKKKERNISASISPPAKKEKASIATTEKETNDKTIENKENKDLDNMDNESSVIIDKEPEKQRIIAVTRTIPNILLDKPVEPPRPPSPAQNPTTAIIHVRGLVRPFTLKQLKTLLSQHGELVDDGFWIDQIKSHCYVTYQADESAKAAREALHGAKWPSCNPRELRVDFATQNDIKFARGDLSAKQPPPEVKREEKVSDKKVKTDRMRSDGKERERGRDRAVASSRKDGAVREWDIGKTDRSPSRRSRSPRAGRQHSPHRRSRSRSRNKRKSRENENGHINAEGNKKTEQPAKLLDDLFRKTASQPSIYWLPLTEEQANIRCAERKKQQDEQKKLRAAMGGQPALPIIGSGRRGSISPRRRRW